MAPSRSGCCPEVIPIESLFDYAVLLAGGAISANIGSFGALAKPTHSEGSDYTRAAFSELRRAGFLKPMRSLTSTWTVGDYLIKVRYPES